MSGWSRAPGGGLRKPELVRTKVELTKREETVCISNVIFCAPARSLCLCAPCARLLRETFVSCYMLSLSGREAGADGGDCHSHQHL